MVNPHGQTKKPQPGSVKTNDKQKKQNTLNIPIWKPEQMLRITA